MKTKILDYRLPEHYYYLVKATRYHGTKNEHAKLMLSGGMVIETTVERCLINLLIFRVLDYYKIRDKREEYIYTGSYLKGRPEIYMEKVLDLIETDSYFKHEQDEDTYVLLLPHIIAEIKETFYLISIIVDGMVMTDHALFGYIEGYRKNRAFKKLMDEPIILQTDAPWEVERKLKEMLKLFDNEINIHPLTDFYRSGVKINNAQLMMFLTWGR
ncbi:MAG: hypothetical protein ACRCX2_14740 [Paraclostridium sp.]